MPRKLKSYQTSLGFAAKAVRPRAFVAVHAASVFDLIGSRIEESSFSGLLTRVEISHIRIRSAGKDRTRERGSASSLSQRAYPLVQE